MDVRQISPDYAVCGQIAASDLPTIAKMGFKSVVSNRPEGESQDQETFDVIAAQARDLGLEAAYLPVAPHGASPEDHDAFSRLFERLPKPVLAYCRSGNRSATLWHGLNSAA